MLSEREAASHHERAAHERSAAAARRRHGARAPPGNYVVLDHGNREYSLLAHLRRGSVKVQVGNRVTTGDLLAECGNSGRSSEPHLHYHLPTGPAFRQGVGLPALFNDYFTGRQYRERGEPVRGELLHQVGREVQ